MSTATNANSSAGTGIELTAQPGRITASGIMLLTAVLPLDSGPFDVEWSVDGPVQLSGQDTRIALLGTTTVIANPGQRRAQVILRATLATSPLSVGCWRVRLRLTRVVAEKTEDDATGTDRCHQLWITAAGRLRWSARKRPRRDQPPAPAVERSTWRGRSVVACISDGHGEVSSHQPGE